MNRVLPAVSLFFLALAIIPQAGAAAAPLDAPTGLAATAASGSEIALSWEDNNSPAPKSFSIVRSLNPGSGYVEIAQVSRNVRTYLDMGLSFSTTYYYKVQALATGSKPPSPYSAVAGATTLNGGGDNTPPSVPQNLTARGSTCISARVEWSPSSDSEAGVAGYRVFRNGQFIATTGFTYYNDWNLPEQTSFTYQVEAYDASGNTSGRSNSATATTLVCPDVNPPTEPGWISAQDVSCTEVAVSWGASTDVGTGVAAYQVWFFNAPFTLVDGNQTSLVHTNSYIAGYTLSYSVEAIDGHGNHSTVAGPTYVTVQTCGGGNLPPVASPGPDRTVDVGNPVSFNGSGSSDPDGSIVSYHWSFGDGGSATGVTASHTYSQAGTYPVVLTVTDNGGLSNNASASVLVQQPTNEDGGDTIWSKSLGTSAWESGVSAMADTGDSILMVGKFSGSSNVGGSNINSSGGTDLFLAEYTPSGSHVWSRSIGGSGGETPMDLAVDAAGNAIACGSFTGTTDLGDGPATSVGGLDGFVAKYSGSGGSLLWARRFGSTAGDMVTSVTADFRGDILVTGSFGGTVDFGGISLTSADTDTFVAKLSGDNGATLWARSYENLGVDEGLGLAVDGNGDLYVTGYFRGLIDFGDGLISTTGRADIFLLRLDGTFGDLLWALTFGGDADDIGHRVGTDAQDNVILISTYEGSVNMGGSELAAAGITDMALSKYSPAGAYRWSETLGGQGPTEPTGLSVDPSGDVVVAGWFETSTNLGGATYASVGGRDVFVAKYTGGSGAHLWSKAFGSVSTDYPAGLVTDGNGYVTVTGAFWATLDFGDSVRTPAGAADAFLLHMAP